MDSYKRHDGWTHNNLTGRTMAALREKTEKKKGSKKVGVVVTEEEHEEAEPVLPG